MGNLRILVVEDDFLSRSLLSKIVTEYGEIEVAVDGVEAVNAVKRAYAAGKPYDLIFLDIMLPRKDGQTALREIRSFEESSGIFAPDTCKVIMTTALSDAKNVMGAFGAQCEAYIAKPFSKHAIDAELRKILPEGDKPV
jgi:two-component system chemotaxis response regulator CheY